MAETVVLPLTGAGGSTADVAVDTTPDGAAQIVKLAVSADGSATLIPADADGLLVKLDQALSPQDTSVVAIALGAGANTDLNADDITAGKTGRLLAVDVGASVPLRVDIQSVDGARVTRTTLYTQAGESKVWRSPAVGSVVLVGGVGKHYGLSVTNLSPHLAADARATIYWDEVT